MSGSGGNSIDNITQSIGKGINDGTKDIFSYDISKGKFQSSGDSVFKSVSQIDGYDPDTGKWGGKGSDVDWFNEGLGQVNGTNAARHAAGVAGDAVILAKQQADTLLAQTNEAKHQSDVQASSQAAGIRATAQVTGGFNPSMTTPMALGSGARAVVPKLGSDHEDFLGL